MNVGELEFVYDRTQEDVNRVIELNKKYLNGTITQDEIREWNNGLNGRPGLKGAFNLSDINRIEGNIDIISKVFIIFVNTKKWELGDTPRVSDYQRIRENTEKIHSLSFVRSDTPEVPDSPLNTYQKWNDIEKILYDAYDIYIRLRNSYYYCDTEIYSGEGIGDL